MKKILLTFMMSFFCFNAAFGVTVCVKKNTYIAYLKKGVDGSSGTTDNAAKEWSVVFDYGTNGGGTKTITGLAACNEISGTYATAKTNLYTSANDVGQYCWCEIGPINGAETGLTSFWVFLDEYSDVATCASSCTAACMNAVKSNSTFRSAIFESIW